VKKKEIGIMIRVDSKLETLLELDEALLKALVEKLRYPGEDPLPSSFLAQCHEYLKNSGYTKELREEIERRRFDGLLLRDIDEIF
jgi:hypothetical protein